MMGHDGWSESGVASRLGPRKVLFDRDKDEIKRRGRGKAGRGNLAKIGWWLVDRSMGQRESLLSRLIGGE